MTLLLAYLVGLGLFGLLTLATAGLDRLTPTAPRPEEGRPA